MPATKPAAGQAHFARIQWGQRELQIEYQWLGPDDPAAPVMAFLHEGLGSLALWKDFPQRLCSATGMRGLIFSRYAYGNSTARPPHEKWPVQFMHDQAREVLPLLFRQLGIHRPWLFGHSDGGSIALLYAASFPQAVRGVIVAAPHIFVEDITIASIKEARLAYLQQDQRDCLRNRLGRYHADPDSAFWGWNDIWLHPGFRQWNIEQDITSITCPLLAVQGEDDEYGTLEQLHGIRRRLPATQLLILPQCGHSPHRDQPETLIRETRSFMHQTTQDAAAQVP